jgi:DNA-binding response OmpR family regulator
MSPETIWQLIERLDHAESLCVAARDSVLQIRAAVVQELNQLAGPAAREQEPTLPRVVSLAAYPVADASTFEVRWRGNACVLGRLPFRLFRRLMLQPGRFVPYEQLMEDVWGGPKADDTIRSAIRHLKHQLRDGSMEDLAACISGRDRHYALCIGPGGDNRAAGK